MVSGEDDDPSNDPEESTTSLKVVWHPPENMGPRTPALTYAVVFKKSTETSFGDAGGGSIMDTTVEITGLEADTSYDVRVQATNRDGAGLWSLVGTGSTNKEGNSPPSFNETDSLVELDVHENTPAGENIDSPVTATDGDTTTLTYEFDGPHADLFSFDTRSAQIRTKAPLNHEDARCGYVDGANQTQCIYRVTVIVTDGAGGSDATRVNIKVEDKDEPASAPARPTVRATEKSSTSLDVSWDEPTNMGPPITGYNVQYRKGSDPFSTDGVVIAGTTATISGIGDHDDDVATDEAPWLSSNTTYEVRVQAENDERDSAWSGTGTGRTNRANHQPIFDDRPGTGDGSKRGSDHTASRTIDENIRTGQIVGRVFADDQDNDSLTYKLVAAVSPYEGDVNKFTINETTGEIRTKAGVTYNYEDIDASETCGRPAVQGVGSDRCYTVKVEVRDGLDDDRVEVEVEDADDSITVKVGVRDRDEPPAVPTVTVTSPAGNTTLIVIWDARNTGPEITGYDVQYRKGGGAFSDENCSPAGTDNCNGISGTTTTTITGLDADTSYSVQVRAKNDEGTSAWSPVATVKTNKDENALPTFNDAASPLGLTVAENTPSGRDVGNAVDATDSVTESPTYELRGRDAGLFTIVRSSGQIRTRLALNTEAICSDADVNQDGGHQENCTYRVIVKVDDEAGGSASKEVTITVSDIDEPPSAPSAPRVTATKDTGWSLDVTWNEPRDTGKPPITDYDIQYRKFKSGTPKDQWEDWPHGANDNDSTERKATITSIPDENNIPVHLEPRTQYEVRVRAKNGEGNDDAPWLHVGRGTTNASNSRPSFDRDGAVELSVDENTRAGQSLGSAISASDADSNSLTYTLEGPGADSFTIVSSSGQIRTKSPLDYETRQSYSVTVKADDGQKRKNSVAAKSVTIMVDNVREAPSPPAAPMVAGIPGSTSSIRVTWAAPANTGPSIKGYDVHYREVGSGWGRWPHASADISTIITELKAGTRYEVQVRARSDEGTGDWGRVGSGAPNPDVANRNPVFSGGSRTLSVAENTLPNTDVGAPVAATDRDGDTLTYALEGADADSFDILSTSDGGQIRTSAALNHEKKASYAVTVRVTDGRGGSDAVNLTIRVTDVDGEAPDTPFAPTVTAVSSTRLQVSWEAPANTGPPITDYDYRYREPAGSWTEVINTRITGTAVTIEGLAASTSYDVEVRATNAEGTSGWSNPGIGATNAPGANNPPVFSEGTSATRSVSATAPAGTSIGLPVAATDADSGDTVTYSLEGRDAANFDITTSNGQLLTKSGITLIAGDTYTVTVVADDETDRASITVTIDATVAPPNNPPVFSDGASATRSVREDAAPGTSIGSPVRATDADTGDTVTHILEGTDAAAFTIVASSGQIRTLAALDATTKATYAVTVRATDGRGGSATIGVTITVTTALPNSAPVFSEGTSATRSVAENTPAGQNVGIPVSATDPNDDALTYTLGGRDAASFDIVPTTGQIQTKAALDYETDFRYSVTVTVSDDQLTGSITVTINVTDMHPSCASAIGNGANIGLANDCEALLDLKATLEGSSGSSLNWATFTPIADWDGFQNTHRGLPAPSLDGSPKRVTRLYLQRAELDGIIPPDLGRLTELTHIFLWGNTLRGAVPAELGNLTKLERLYINNNQLTGFAQSGLEGMTSLKILWAHRNEMSGSVPTQLADITSLTWLSLYGNHFTGGIPGAELKKLTNLKRLYLHRNNLGGPIPADLGEMTSLTHIQLMRTGVNGSIPASLGNLTNLEWLSLYDNELTGSIPSQLGSLSSLEVLYLHSNRLDNNVPDQLGDLSSLTNLWLKDNRLTGQIPMSLGDLPNIERVRIRDNQFTGCMPAGLLDDDTVGRTSDAEWYDNLPVCSNGN